MNELVWVLLGFIGVGVFLYQRERSKRFDLEVEKRNAEYERLWSEEAKKLRESKLKAKHSKEEYEKLRNDFMSRVDASDPKKPKS